MDILDIINEPVDEREEVIEYKGVKYLFRASSDAGEQLDSYMASEVDAQKWAKHCTVITGRPVKPEMARWCHMVAHTLQPVQWNETLNEWEPRKMDGGVDRVAWDITEIVALSQRIGTDFVTVFLGAAKKVLGTDKTAEELADPDTKDNTFTKVAAGNSEESETVS